jgi:hypothetical protein
MANKYIRDLSTTTNPSLTGHTIFDNGTTTYKTTLETLKDIIVDGESHTFEGNQTINGNLTVTGSITANEFIVSSSVTHVTTLAQSGSTSFGDSLNDNHNMTGSLKLSGSLQIDGAQSVKDFLFVSGFAVIGEPIHHMDHPEALHVGTKNSINIAHFAGNNNDYTQVFIKNLNSGSNASSDFVAVSDNGTEDERYINIGINSSTYDSNNGIGGPNDSYIINNGGTLWVGSLDGQKTKFFNIDYDNPLITLFAGNYIGFGTENISENHKFEFSGSAGFINDISVGGDITVAGDVIINGTSYNASTSGTSGSSGSSGTAGSSGSSGSSGTSGTSGSSGSSGSSGTSGTSGTSGDSLFAETGSVWSTTNDVQITGSLNVNGTAVIGTGIGEEGGEMMLVKPITNTNISGSGIIIDSYRDRIRIFEQGGDTRGAFLDITKQSNAVTSQIVTSPNLFSIQTITSASYAALTPVSGTLYIIID